MRATPSLHATQSTQTEVYARWARDPEGFWAEAGEAIHWSKRWDRVLDSARAPFYRWFPGATVNTCENALDWHVEHGRADQPALIYDSPVTGTIKTFTYRELRDAVARFAGVLLGQGVGRGDRVIIYMPMVPEAAIAMLACARIGGIHSVVFGGFASHELAARISHAAPVVIVSASGGIEVNRVVRDNGGHLVALKWSMTHIYGVEPGEVYWAASDLGWAVGHSYIVYGPLFNGNTTVLYEGKPVGTPDPGAFWRVISQHRVSVFFTAPTAIRAIKRDDPTGEHVRHYDLGGFRTFFLAGERCDPDTLHWAEQQLGVPVIDHWWQTETGWPIGVNCMGLGMLPVKPGSCAKPVAGYDVRVLDEDGKEVAAGVSGNIVIRLPLPPGCLPTLWKNDDGYVRSYLSRYPGYYLTADAGYKDDDGYLWVMGRTDDIINVSGHRLSTGAMEEVLASHADVAECAVVGVADAIKGEVPLGLIVFKAGVGRPAAAVVEELVGMVRERIGPVAAFRLAIEVQRLPKTRSGKILRGTIKKIADGVEYRVPPTIDDPASLEEIAAALATVGYPRR